MSTSNINTKRCTKCSVPQPLAHFYKTKANKDGLANFCKACSSARNRTRRENNIERIRATEAAYAATHREEIRVKTRAWYQENKPRKREVSRAWEARNSEYVKEKQSEWRAANRESGRQAVKNFWRRNPGTRQHADALRRASKLQATPGWVVRDALIEIYAAAAAMRKAGLDVHVDHIVPLRGRGVCGLHVPWNLRIIPAEENMRKGNRF